MKGKMIMNKQVKIHLKNDKYVSIIQDVNDTVEIAIIDSRGVDNDTVKRYLNTQELAIELLNFNLDRYTTIYNYMKG